MKERLRCLGNQFVIEVLLKFVILIYLLGSWGIITQTRALEDW